MTKDSFRLVAYGFVKKGVDKKNPTIEVNGKKINIEGDKPEKKLAFIDKLKKEYGEETISSAMEKIADHDEIEAAKDQILLADYPSALNKYQISLESFHQSIEQYYFWCLNFLSDLGYPIVHKVTDVFTASEHSSFYGSAGQRLAITQDRINSYLASIGKMVKDLYQLVRELRQIDEKLEIYRGSMGLDKDDKPKKDKEGKEIGPIRSDEVALKSLWMDLVDGVVGGQRTGSNILTMTQQVGFSSLIDWFIKVHPRNSAEIEKVVEEQVKSNDTVKDAIRRKLSSYLAWKAATFDELRNRRKFSLQYMRQHYHVIKMYMNWIKPYLKHAERMSLQQDLLSNPRLIASFESSLIEIEVLAQQRIKDTTSQNVCMLITFEYSTKPQLQFQAEGYQRGPIHVGTVRITWRGYTWSDAQVKSFIAMKDKQDLELLGTIDASIKSAMDQLGNDILKYLEEAEGKPEEKKQEPAPTFDLLEPFTAVGKGAFDVLKAFLPSLETGKKPEKKEEGDAGKAKGLTFVHYNVFKKAHGLISW